MVVHICQTCGMKQYRASGNYRSNPKFAVYDARREDDRVICEMGVDMNRRFECETCGHTVQLSDDVRESDATWKTAPHVSFSEAVSEAKMKFRSEYDDPTDILE